MKIGNVSKTKAEVLENVDAVLYLAGVPLLADIKAKVRNLADRTVEKGLSLRDEGDGELEKAETELTKVVTKAEKDFGKTVGAAQKVFRPKRNSAYAKLEEANRYIRSANRAYEILEDLS